MMSVHLFFQLVVVTFIGSSIVFASPITDSLSNSSDYQFLTVQSENGRKLCVGIDTIATPTSYPNYKILRCAEIFNPPVSEHLNYVMEHSKFVKEGYYFKSQAGGILTPFTERGGNTLLLNDQFSNKNKNNDFIFYDWDERGYAKLGSVNTVRNKVDGCLKVDGERNLVLQPFSTNPQPECSKFRMEKI